MLGMLIIAQTSLATVGDTLAVDLHAAIAPPCVVKPDEITVCGRQGDETFRLRPLPADKFEPQPLRATTNFLGGTAGIEAEQKGFSNGSVSKQAKVTLRFKF